MRATNLRTGVGTYEDEQLVHDTDEQRKTLFMCAWPFVSSWIADNFRRALFLKRQSRRRLTSCWKTWVDEAAIFPPPLVSSSESDDLAHVDSSSDSSSVDSDARR